ELDLRGWVSNDGDGVSIYACGSSLAIDTFVTELPRLLPPLARVDELVRTDAELPAATLDGFHIAEHAGSAIRTGVVPDRGICGECLAEIRDPLSRRYRYPFTNCTHCGPRLTIVEGIPYDRARTTMVAFELCDDCRAEYQNPSDRRFHAQPIA